MEIFETTKADFERLKSFMELVDGDFFPPLSSRPGGIQSRISGSLARKDSNYFIADLEGELVGAIGFSNNWNDSGEAYISFLAVHPQYRGNRIASLLDRELQRKLRSEGIRYVNITTWSTSPGNCEVYKRLGYSIARVVKDDRGPGVDTVFLRKNIPELKKELRPLFRAKKFSGSLNQ